MNSHICYADLSIDFACIEKLKRLYPLYMDHRFNLLGSGSVKVNYELQAKGLHGKKYHDPSMEKYGRRVKRGLCGQGKCTDAYEPINWFVDYKSGFFFHPGKYNSIEKCQAVIEKVARVDIKCPWELGRLYHLPQLAVLAVADATLRETILWEFRNEIVDFIETNPPEKTVQWSAPMDVSVRMVNMLVAYDILVQLDEKGCLNREFQLYFEEHIRTSLKFVMNHLEFLGRVSANHYLSNIVGIIFAAAYLPDSRWVNSCLVFGAQELIEQVEVQFYEEGGHNEGSVSYHRLSAEFVLYAAALLCGVLKTKKRTAFLEYDCREIKRLKRFDWQKFDVFSEDFFPEWFWNRLCSAGIFTSILSKNNHEIVQIGDNDSGRLLKLTPMINENTMEENDLDHRTLLSAMNGMFTNEEFVESGRMIPLETGLIRSLSGHRPIKGHTCIGCLDRYDSLKKINEIYEYAKEYVLFQDNRTDLTEDVKIYYFEKFGVVILKGSRLFLSMVIDTTINTVYSGHTHNDKLSVEVMIDGNYITRDPGGYIYTAFLRGRDKFRSVNAHNTIRVDGYEQDDFNGTWAMKKRAKAELLYCTKDMVAATVTYKDVVCLRKIEITGSKIIVKDSANKPFKAGFQNRIYSDGYGKLKRVKR